MIVYDKIDLGCMKLIILHDICTFLLIVSVTHLK